MTRIRNGIRYYGCWAGNEKGRAEDKTRCIEEVAEGGRSMMYHQCSRKRGHGPNGDFCKIHDPAAKAARDAKSRAKYEEHSERLRKGWEGGPWLKALVAIANGHNDPTALARQTIKACGRDYKTGDKLPNKED